MVRVGSTNCCKISAEASLHSRVFCFASDFSVDSAAPDERWILPCHLNDRMLMVLNCSPAAANTMDGSGNQLCKGLTFTVTENLPFRLKSERYVYHMH